MLRRKTQTQRRLISLLKTLSLKIFDIKVIANREARNPYRLSKALLIVNISIDLCNLCQSLSISRVNSIRLTQYSKIGSKNTSSI